MNSSPTAALLPANTFLADAGLTAALARLLPPAVLAWAEPALTEAGAMAPAELLEWGDECERHPAYLRTIEPWGERVDEVVYPDAWWRIKAAAARLGAVGLPYEPAAREAAGPAARVVHAALGVLMQPGTATYFCPVAMTDAAARVLVDFGPGPLRDAWVPRLVSRDGEGSWTAGQWMTEHQGGSDVGANTVRAVPDPDGAGLAPAWRLSGRKFFCSNVGGEMVLALARPEGGEPGTRGLGLFLIPRDLPGGGRNRYRIDRLKEKLGTRAMATGEVTLEGALAWQVGGLERGFQQMTPMLNITRLHNAVSSAAGMRRGLMLARGYAARRHAFGRPLDQQPLHRAVLTDIAADGEGCLLMALRMAELLGRQEQGVATVEEQALFRVGSSLTKLYTAKRAVAVASEVLECFGGPGYMEDTGIPRLLRDAQVLPIWEGTTSVLSLDTLRVLAKPGMAAAFDAELERLDAPARGSVESLLARLSGAGPEDGQRMARHLAWTMAEAWVEGLLADAARHSRRQAHVLEAWQRRGTGATDLFNPVVDGT